MNEDLIELFVEEARDLVARAQDDLVALEAQPNDAALLGDLFRAVHTLKGSVGFFDWPYFGDMLHAAEDLLSAIRAGELTFCDRIVAALGAAISQTEAFVTTLAQTGALPESSAARAAPIARALKQALDGSPDAPPATDLDAVARELIARATRRSANLPASLFVVRYTPARDAFMNGEDPVAIARATPGLIELRVSAREAWRSLDAYDPFACNLQCALLSGAPQHAIEAAYKGVSGHFEIAPARAPGSDDAQPAAAVSAERRTLRVDADRIDALMHAVDELIVAKNGMSDLAVDASHLTGEELSQKVRDHQAAIGRLTARMHAAVTAMRLVPIAPALNRLPRIARELGERLGKPLDVVLDCEDLEADKTVVDAISEPLLHLVRNAVDHGVETPEQRRASGKPERAQIKMSARRRGDQVVIAVEDDGRGVDVARVRDVARRRGVMSDAAIDALDDAQALDLVFQPGFSTASQVSETSGRGVGMDAVRMAALRLGGTVSLASRPGAGATVTLTLPLSMMLTQIAVVECDGETFGVPMDDILELARVSSDDVQTVRHGRATTMRGRPTPLVSLESLLGRSERAAESSLRVLVVDVAGEQIAISVARLVERIEAIVTPVGGLLAGMKGFSGTTLTGSGSVLMILNVSELIS